MTAYTRKLYSRNRAAAADLRRLKYGKHTTLACFVLDDEARYGINKGLLSPAGVQCQARIEDDFDVASNLDRFADRRFRS